MAAKEPQAKGTTKQDHAERAAAALRENLRKRKAQQRQRAAQPAPGAQLGDAADEEKKWEK